MSNKVVFSQIKVGEVLSETQYYRVAKRESSEVYLTNDFGEQILVDSTYAEKCLTSASQFSDTKAISKTEAANLFLNNPSVAMTVNFNKQVDVKKAKEALYNLYPNKGGKILAEKDFKKAVDEVLKSVTTGEERTIVGRHFGEINEFGRVQFIDMEETKDPAKAYDNRLRQVDPRTINWLIVRGVKYTVKK